MFKVGDKVMLKPDKDEYTHGKGSVLYTDVGEITAMFDNDIIFVNFPDNPDWLGKADDLVLYEEIESNIVIPDDEICKYFLGGLHNPMLDNEMNTEELVVPKLNIEIIKDIVSNIQNGLSFDFKLNIGEEREEKNMNKVLKLYYDRKREEIHKKYEEKVDNDFNNIDVVKQYKTLIENFEKEQEALFKTVENFDNDYLVPSYDSNLYKYSISELKVKDSLMATYEDDKVNEIEKLKELVEEVDAQLSLSDDLNYQMEVLTRYDILDKKTNKVKA